MYGTVASNLADFPHRSSTLAYAMTALDVLRFGLVMGNDGPKATPPLV
jgi:hypothetical protein